MTPAELWQCYRQAIGKPGLVQPPAEYFCDNQDDADQCATLVCKGSKRATSSAQWSYTQGNVPLPRPGDLLIVTNWKGEAQCIIETISVSIVPFNEVQEDFAAMEGEGDRTLEHWRKAHRSFFEKQFSGSSYSFNQTMPIVCQTFRVIFQ